MELRTEIEILASVERVWDVLSDFSRYPEWNPFIVKLEGEAQPGARLSVTLSLPDSNREHAFRPRLLLYEPRRELRWLGHRWMKGLLDTEHFYRLEERGPELTRFSHGADVSGAFLRFVMKDIGETTRGCAYMNQALKRRVEGTKA